MTAPDLSLVPDPDPADTTPEDPTAEDPTAEPTQVELWPSPNNPMGTARRILEDFQEEGQHTIVQWQGSWWRWFGPSWREVKPAELGLYQELETAQWWNPKANRGDGEVQPWHPNRRKIGDLEAALTALTFLGDHVLAPSWLAAEKYPACEIVACTNGLLHAPTKELLGLTATYFNRVSVPFDYDAAAPAPVKWMEFLDQVWGSDQAAIASLQEWFGYVLSGRTDLQKAFLMIGPTRSGKGTIARVLKELIGSGATAGPTLPSLATNFGLQTLIGKPLAIVSDARLTQQSATQAVERLLQITGEDMVTADRKFMDPRNGQLPTRFMILSNELPKFYDAGGAIAKRMVITQMTESFLGREDPRLTRSLLAELPGILNWALDGLDHLVKAGSFTEPDSSYAARQILEDSVSPVAAFVRDYCEVGTDKSATKDAIFTEWKMWCEKTNHLAGSPANFARNLLAAVPTARPARPRDGGQRVHTFEGIELKPFHKRDT